jgi:hypothetical protein
MEFRAGKAHEKSNAPAHEKAINEIHAARKPHSNASIMRPGLPRINGIQGEIVCEAGNSESDVCDGAILEILGSK